ncbi:MFS transporter [Homoserinibacter sp. GY 40078]|uniref:MFS transporter n=1 Tax=Homoserinibacter sp. GY 40078 TaxID=2603275 RepID=UPI0011CBCC42|nr:MFS transporter [Homoserinibacter sp. GY 40078]TXK16347.1 MFS transporter [Homoserinibacter sp. GY 40078]
MSERSQPRPWWVGVVSGMASYIDAAAIMSFGIAIVIHQAVLGLDAAQVGAASAILTVGIAIGALVGGKLGDRFGRRPVFTITMIVVVLGSALLVVGGSFGLIVAGAALVGLGTGADLPVSLSTISEAANDTNRGRIVAFSNVLWLAGVVSGILIGTVVGNLGELGAQILFIHVGGVAFIVLLLRLTIPESAVWLAARRARQAGEASVRAERTTVRELLRAPYLAPLLGLAVFYALVNLGYNTFGQFGPYLLVNAAGTDVSTASALSLASVPVGLIGILWFMKIVDKPRRFVYFTVGAVLSVVGLLIPAVFGFSVATYLVAVILLIGGGTFAGEAIMKVWTQEQFPTLLRTTAQGTVIAVARFVAAAGAAVTPMIVEAGASVLFLLLAIVSGIGLLVAWLVFRTRDRRNEFLGESRPDELVATPGS